MLKDFRVDAVGGYSIGADPIVTAIAVLSHQAQSPVPAFIIRKEERSLKRQRIELEVIS